MPGLHVQFQLGKAKYWQGADAGIAAVPDSDLPGFLSDEHVILGATAYSAIKLAMA